MGINDVSLKEAERRSREAELEAAKELGMVKAGTVRDLMEGRIMERPYVFVEDDYVDAIGHMERLADMELDPEDDGFAWVMTEHNNEFSMDLEDTVYKEA